MKSNQTFLIGTSVAILGIMVAMMSLANGLIISAYAVGKQQEYCTNNGATCFNGLGNCRKYEQSVIDQGGTITGSCQKQTL